MGKYSRLGKNTIFVFIGNIGGKVLAFLMLPLYTRWLSVSDFGTVDILMTYASLLFGLVTLSISESVFIFPKGKPFEVQKSYFTSGFLFTFFYFILTGGLVLLYLCIPGKVSKNALPDYIWLVYLLIFTMFLQGYIQQFTRSIDKMSVYSISGLVLSVSIIVNSFLFIPRFGIYGYVLTWMVSYTVTALYSLYFSGAYKFFSLAHVSIQRYKEMLRYAVPLIPNSVMFWLINSLNRPLMEKYLGLEAVGIYAVANKFPFVLSTLFNVFLLSWHITVLEEYKEKGYEQFFNRMLRYVVLFLGIIFFVISVFNKVIIKILASSEFYEAWKYIPLLTLGSVILSLSAFVGGNFLATRESKYFLYSSVIGAFFSVILNFLLIPLYGIWGSVVSVIISYFIMLLVRLFYIRKTIRLYYTLKYAAMLLLFVLVAVTVNINDGMYKYWLIVIEVSALLYVNRDLKKDGILAFQIVRNFIKKKLK